MKLLLLAVENDMNNFARQQPVWAHYGVRLERACSMPEAVEHLAAGPCSMVGVNADSVPDYLSCLKILREATAAPIHVLTSRYSYEEHLLALHLGADYYGQWLEDVERSTRRGLAMLERYIARGARQGNAPRILSCGDLFAFPEYREVFRKGVRLGLSKKEYEVLVYLMSHYGRVLTYEQIYYNVWGQEYHDLPHNLLWNQIRSLRRKLNPASRHHDYIRNIRDVGYRFVAVNE